MMFPKPIANYGRRPYVHTPDEYLDLGELGEHPVEYVASITDVDFVNRTASVAIWHANVTFKLGETEHKLDLVKKICAHAWRRRKIEDEIARAYFAAADADTEPA